MNPWSIEDLKNMSQRVDYVDQHSTVCCEAGRTELWLVSWGGHSAQLIPLSFSGLLRK